MTQEEKQLLLQDLCARLPYGVKVQYDNGIYNIDYISALYEEISLDIPDNYTIGISEIKPYLRPLSSMTEEEKKSLPFPWVYNFGVITSYCESEGFLEIRDYECSCIIDWLNANNFDYRGLIQKGLAISTEEFNPYED